ELLEAARRIGGIDVRFGAEVIGIERDGGRVIARARSSHGAAHEVDGRFLVVADGARSGALAALGLSRRRVVEGAPRLLSGVFRQRGDGVLDYEEVKSGDEAQGITRNGALHETV